MIDNTLYNNVKVEKQVLAFLSPNTDSEEEKAQKACKVVTYITLPCLFLECRANFYL